MSEPYLSIIATSRNDDHGGSMLQRMQAFVEGLCGQAERWGLDAELILVEWNPPSDRPPLAEALTWPKKRGRLSIRIITVPFEAHMALVHGDKMGLYQMIAKNVGARRAKGKFLLFTNVDILFNDELIQNLVRENLAPKILYRIDRTDVRNEIPLGQGIATMLAWAKCHQLRHNRPASTIRVHPDGKPKWEKVIDPRIGPLFGFSECHEEQGIVSYLQPLARFQVYETQPTLVVELEPLVLDITGSLPLDFCDDSGNLLHRILLGGRENISSPLVWRHGQEFTSRFAMDRFRPVLGIGLSFGSTRFIWRKHLRQRPLPKPSYWVKDGIKSKKNRENPFFDGRKKNVGWQDLLGRWWC